MKVNLACKRFHKLWSDQLERELSAGESRFLLKHREVCDQCCAYEESADSAMSFLRQGSLEADITDGFDERVVRIAKVQIVRQSLTYWSPAFVGGAIACIALVAAMQIAAAPVQIKRATFPDGEARMNLPIDRQLPKLILNSKPHFDQ